MPWVTNETFAAIRTLFPIEIYWTKENGNLAALIDQADKMKTNEIQAMGKKAKKRIEDAYSWEYISRQYEDVFFINAK